MQFKGAVAIEDAVDMRQLVEVILHAFHVNHRLPAMIDGHSLILHALRGHSHLVKCLYLYQFRVVGSNRLSLYGHNLELWVEGREK